MVDNTEHRPAKADDSSTWTTNAGQPIYDNDDSLTVGRRGPILLEDYHLQEKLAQFDRERIPERVVHARGITAKGVFEVTHDISHLTCANLLQEVGRQTPVIARFSTVVHERGSPETLRDPRGFSVKFYTDEGIWDLVGNNMPVFFIRDGIKFPDLVHAFKPNPKTHIQEFWRIADFLSHHTECMHMLTFLFDDLGIPLNYRHMDGFGVHTFKLINAESKETYVKFHWRTQQGVKSIITKEEAIQIGGANHSHATKDLYDTIEAGDFPKWDLFIQTMEIEDEDKYEFDPLDNTKTWPEERFPLQPVGTMTLNRVPDNFFNESEMVAFSPANIVPGIYFSDDKLLQTRIFSYADSQRHRLGPNYLTIPVNQPKNKYHNNQHEGFMNTTKRTEEVNYFPSRFDPVKNAKPTPMPQHSLAGKPVKQAIEKQNDFHQAGERYREFDSDRQERFIMNVMEMLEHPRITKELREIWIGYWKQVDGSLGEKLQAKLTEKKLM